MNAQTGANMFGAVQDAVKMYLGLREQRRDRMRDEQADSRAARALTIQEQAAQREIANAESMRLDRERDAAFQTIDRFGGTVADPATAENFRKIGLSAALEDEMTLPTTRTAPGMEGAGDGPTGPVYWSPQPTGSAPTGRTLIRQPETERARIAAYNAQTRAYEGDANRASREAIAGNQIASRERIANNQMKLRQAIAGAAQALQARGIQAMDARALMALQQRAEMFNALNDDRAIDNEVAQMRSNPLAILKYLEDPGASMGRNPAVPDIPVPQGSSQYEIVR